MGLGHDLQEEAFYAGTCPGPLVGAESRWDAVRRWDRRWEGRDLGILGGWDRREETGSPAGWGLGRRPRVFPGRTKAWDTQVG